jgi:hypothetical protein
VAEIRVDAKGLKSLIDALEAGPLSADNQAVLRALLTVAQDGILRAAPPDEVNGAIAGGQDQVYAVVDVNDPEPMVDLGKRLNDAFVAAPWKPRPPATPTPIKLRKSIGGKAWKPTNFG